MKLSTMSFQNRCHDWMRHALGMRAALDPVQRSFRLLEEAVECGQALGLTEAEAARVVRYVYSRPKGEVAEEVAGTMLTLAALANAVAVNIGEVAEVELVRIWDPAVVEKIRGRQADKPGRP